MSEQFQKALYLVLVVDGKLKMKLEEFKTIFNEVYEIQHGEDH